MDFAGSVAKKGADLAGTSAAAPAPVALTPHLRDLEDLRSQMYSLFAEVEDGHERQLADLRRRVRKIESHRHPPMPEEIKGFLVMGALYVGVSVILPELIALVAKWRQSRSS